MTSIGVRVPSYSFRKGGGVNPLFFVTLEIAYFDRFPVFGVRGGGEILDFLGHLTIFNQFPLKIVKFKFIERILSAVCDMCHQREELKLDFSIFHSLFSSQKLIFNQVLKEQII